MPGRGASQINSLMDMMQPAASPAEPYYEQARQWNAAQQALPGGGFSGPDMRGAVGGQFPVGPDQPSYMGVPLMGTPFAQNQYLPESAKQQNASWQVTPTAGRQPGRGLPGMADMVATHPVNEVRKWWADRYPMDPTERNKWADRLGYIDMFAAMRGLPMGHPGALSATAEHGMGTMQIRVPPPIAISGQNVFGYYLPGGPIIAPGAWPQNTNV